ncbi:MAG: flagellar hook-length control protein FliK [Dissulfurimicrobium sp.]|uniref:flagellar hook-length control protein FliK n=1 Tax=Dissulfurimicrobium TaxID=1769732 RepID=UPI003C7883BE
MQILPQVLDIQIDAVSPGIKSDITAMTSNRSDSPFQDLLRTNQRADTKVANQPWDQNKKAASSSSPMAMAANQPYGQDAAKSPDKNGPSEAGSSSGKIPKDTETARTNQGTAVQRAGEIAGKTDETKKDDKADNGCMDTTDIILAAITIGQQGVTVKNVQTTDHVQGGNAEPGMTKTVSTKNDPIPTDATYIQDDMPSGLLNASPLATQAASLMQQPAAQTSARGPASQNVSQEIIKMAADKPSMEPHNITPKLLSTDVELGAMPSMTGKTSQDTTLIPDKGADQTQQSSSQTSATSLGTALPGKDPAAQTSATNRVDRVDKNTTWLMDNQGVTKADKAAVTPLSAAADATGSHRQISGQANLQDTQTDGAANAAEIAVQPIQAPKDQKISRTPQDTKDAAAATQSVTDGGKASGPKIVDAGNRQDGAWINTESDSAERTAKPQDDKTTKAQDQTPGQQFAVAANNAADNTSSGVTHTHIEMIDKKDLAQVIKDQVFSNLSTGDKHVVLHLDPPDLGKIRIDLTITGNNELKATFAADHPDVRNIIQGQMDGLKSHLDQKGFNVTQLKVDGGTQTNFTSLDQGGQGDPGNWAQEVIRRPFSRNDTGKDDINATTDGLAQNASTARYGTQNGGINLII